MDVGNKRIKIKEMSDILASRFAFITGTRTKEGNPVLIFPDSRSQLTEDELHLLVSYLLQIPPLEEEQKSYVIIIDRRMDKWSSVRLLLSYLMSSFPRPVRIVIVLKPESVLQRALEVGYRGISENCKFKLLYIRNNQFYGKKTAPTICSV
ncbi:unnamed protein product [Cercopithifilaria johnstoni]|uniref:CRAL-TRIO domain-containing protein n=1 Tax=Cercopithifilaria johnstoni TaxID=2874296 RepID=A0A8J2PYD2_9BILA|nr:unnamed protein product [Cercopithifilaria johnstoni]